VIEKKATKPAPCLVLSIVRLVCGVDQGELARELNLDPRRLSARERNTNGAVPSREEIVECVRAMNQPEELVDITYGYVCKVRHLFTTEPTAFNRRLRAMADQLGASISQDFLESSTSASKEASVSWERDFADSCWLHYSRLPPASRRRALEEEALFHRWGFAERLWRESLNAAADDAKRALELGELAVLVADRVVQEEASKSRLLGLAWSAVANARRVGGQLIEAERDFTRAKGLWEAGAPGEQGALDEARFRKMESALRVDQRRFPEALACIEAAFRAARPGEDIAYLLISKGNILFHLQRYEEAAAIYREANTKLGSFSSPRDRFGTLFNLSACLIAVGQAVEAEKQLPTLRKMAVMIGNGLDLLRVRWLEGQTLAGLGQREEAVQTLGEVRDVFLAHENLWDAAVAALERAALQLEGGALVEVKEEAPKLAAAFRSLGVARELLMSLNLFWSAAQAELATAEQARQILNQLRHARVSRETAA